MKNLIYKFSKLKTWQKIGIGIGILTIFKYLSMGCIIQEVKAEEINIPNILIIDPVTGQPIKEDINISAPFASNFISKEDLEKMQNKWYIEVERSAVNKDNEFITKNNTTQSYLSGNMLLDLPTTNDYISYVTGIYLNNRGSKIEPLERNIPYTMLIAIHGDGIKFKNGGMGGTNQLDNFFDINTSYCKVDDINNCNSMQGLYDYEIEWLTGDGFHYNNEFVSFIKLKITPNNLFPNDTDYSLSTINIKLKNNFNVGDTINNNFNYFFKNSDFNEISKYTISDFYIIIDGDIIVEKEKGSYGFPGELITKQEYENCDTLDIACHVRNIQKGIENFGKNILYSLKSLFSYIFIPDFNIINNTIDEINDIIAKKYPDIQALFDYIEYFRDRLLQVSDQTSVSFPGVRYPFDENVWVIEPFTYDFANIINDPRINPYYMVGRVVIIFIVSISWGIWLINWVKSILHNTPKIEM